MTKRVPVAQRSSRCRLCKELPGPSLTAVNAVIWTDASRIDRAGRSRSYRADAVRACDAQGLVVEEKSITRHAEHVERTVKVVGRGGQQVAPGEEPVLPTGFAEVNDEFVRLGMTAVNEIKGRITDLEPRELVATARMGLQASTQREALRIRQQEAADTTDLLRAVFGLSSGVLSEDDVPEVEIIDVTPAEGLLEEVRAERLLLMEKARVSA